MVEYLKFLVGFLHLNRTAGCELSTLIFEKKFMERERTLQISHENFPTEKFLPTWGLGQRYYPGL